MSCQPCWVRSGNLLHRTLSETESAAQPRKFELGNRTANLLSGYKTSPMERDENFHSVGEAESVKEVRVASSELQGPTSRSTRSGGTHKSRIIVNREWFVIKLT